MNGHYSRLFACFVVTLCLQGASAATPEETIAQIKLRNKESLSKLKTWTGKAKLSFAQDESHRTSKPLGQIALEKWISYRQSAVLQKPEARFDPEMIRCLLALSLGEVDIHEGDVEFAFDAATQIRRWNWSSKSMFTNGVELTEPYAIFNGMFKDDLFFRFGPAPPKRGSYMATIHEKDGAQFSGYRSLDFDPTFFFTIEGKPFDYLDAFISTNEYKQNVECSESDTEIVITSKQPNSTQIMTFTPAGLLSRYEFQSDMIRTFTKIDWESINQAWVPRYYHYRSFGSSEQRTPTNVRIVVFTNNSVNTPLFSREFSLHALGVREGDMIQDTRTGETRFVTEED
ncbi:hypothetical protein K2Y11_01200 [bacterium]|nr:hypothetical protein [bacterium]